MSILTLDVGGSPITCTCQRGGHAAPRAVGPMLDADDGTRTSSRTAELMVVPVVLTYLTSSQAATIRALFAIGAQVPCSGDVFNNGNATVVCSGVITDEAIQAATWWELSLTLYEVGSTLGYTPITSTVYLTNVTSPDDTGSGLIKVATGNPAGDSNGTGNVRLLDSVSLPTCGTFPDPSVSCTVVYTDPASPEKIWLTAATIADGWLSGTPVVTLLSKGGTADQFSTQASRADIYVVRGGVDVAEWNTGYSAGNGGFAGGNITMTGTASVIFFSETGDRFRIELFGRAGLHGGYADNNDGTNLARQTVTFGTSGGGFHYGELSLGGLTQVMDPTA